MEAIIISGPEAETLFRIYGAGAYEDGKLAVHPLEALYFMERGKLKLEAETFQSLMEKISKEDDLAQEKYAVLKELRQNGYIMRPSFSKDPMRIYRKGFRPGEDRTQYILKVVKKDSQHSTDGLATDMKTAAGLRKELVYAYVDKGKPVFFKIARTSFE